MDILPYKVDTTSTLLTPRAGLLALLELMKRLNLSACVDKHFPHPKSNRGFKPSRYVQTLMLMQHGGGMHLDDVRLIKEDQGLRAVLSIADFPCATALGQWLRRQGQQVDKVSPVSKVNKHLLKAALHKCKQVTLDIDASEIVSSKRDTKWTYNKHRGYMPMVGHIAETGQIAAVDFREGNTPPSKDNLEFIQTCEAALPEGVQVKAVRIDAAGYQEAIIRYCDTQSIRYAIRAKMSRTIKMLAEEVKDDQWQPLLDKAGHPTDQQTYRIVHCIGEYEQAFTLVIQRQIKEGQGVLAFEDNTVADEHVAGHFIYRAIATNQETLSDSELVHWYNQRGEDSENRIKELKHDFGGDILPCSDFKANALYFELSALSYNLFALLRHLLPETLAHKRAITLRHRLYHLVAKVVRSGRQLIFQLQEAHQCLLTQVLSLIRCFKPPPI